MLRFFLAIAVMLVASAAATVEPMVLDVTKEVEKPQKKFIPLDSARGETKGITIRSEKPLKPLRSDRQLMQQGGMMIDRRLTKPMGPRTLIIQPRQPATLLQSETIAPPATSTTATTVETNPGALERESEEIEGNDEGSSPVLALFGAGNVMPSSFRDAMSGRGSGAIAGVGQQVAWPVPLSVKQYLSSGYGMRADPFTGRPTFHGGIDIAAPSGTPVMATNDAVVTVVTQDGNYGKYITLQHPDGMLSRYGHLSMQSVMEGQHVLAGQVIGAIGATGRATGAHLDYRVSKGGMKFDPLSVLSVPPSVTTRLGTPASLPVAVHDGAPAQRRVSPIASRPLPKSPMVIKVH